MLKDAALLHLEILEKAIPAGWTLKDSSAYNIQFIGARPVFIDIPSFEPYRAGDPWGGYRQFCMMFLYPLMLKAYLGVDFGPMMRAYLDGIDPATANRLLFRAARWKQGVFSHVYLHSKMQTRAAAGELDEAKRLTEDAGGSPEVRKRLRHSEAMVLGLIQGLRSTIAKMKSPDERTVWGDYDADHSYSDTSLRLKKEFVERNIKCGEYRKVWDIGCNTGTFSRLSEPFAEQVISIDGDPKAIDRLYQREKREGAGKILPMIIDLGNVSPNQGWRGAERKSLENRGRPDITLCLALIHHMVIAANIPMREFIDWLGDLGGDLIIEFVTAEDAMARMLLRNKVNQYQDYTIEEFERLIAARYMIADSEELKGGHRKIYYLRRR
jgi:SAM-dependent methyltransferase